MNDPIDIVIPWVDGSDPAWLEEKRKYAVPTESNKFASANSSLRFESWDMRYWFRAVETFMPWYHRIIFVTWGHIPPFLNVRHPKLRIVRHEEYIPAVYLPTFNSNVIELHYHRIPFLSENFILFNDDTLPLKPICESYFFKNNKVCDEAIESIVTVSNRSDVSRLHRVHLLNNLLIINNHFKKREIQKKHFLKWFYPGYGRMLLRNISMHYWYDFAGFYNAHLPVALKKSTLERIWQIESEELDKTSRNKLREINDLTQYLVRYWQLCEGDFYPRRSKGKFYRVNMTNCEQIAKEIMEQKHLMVCLNESCAPEEFATIRRVISEAFERILPYASSFEE